MSEKRKLCILIVDDNEMNREMLIDILDGEYDILEAADGLEALEILQKEADRLDLLLLDIVMPHMDGFGVLTQMIQHKWIETLPVMMISTETKPSIIEKAFDMGVVDFVGRPFVPGVVRHRVQNTVRLYAKQKKMRELIAIQLMEREKEKDMMVTILSHIVESRNGESGLHVLHIGTLTRVLLNQLLSITDRYQLSRKDIAPICMASALHDIGKISVPEGILNKPGRLNQEEFTQIQKHTVYGWEMLQSLGLYEDEALLRYATEICRHHHERWDGKGYPDGLKGDECPIYAQVVAMADVYDALISVRCYKAAYSHERAMEMILNGECGQFNPLLLQCMKEIGPALPKLLNHSDALPEESHSPQLADELSRLLDTM